LQNFNITHPPTLLFLPLVNYSVNCRLF